MSGREPGGHAVRVVRGSQAATAPGQTPGMLRYTGIDAGTAGAQRVWLGRVIGHAGMNSGPHHHGASETAVYVLRGRARIHYGEGFREYVEIGPGDFAFVPAYLPHVEANVSPDEPVEFIVARSPDNTVVNLE